jgi:solute carrier family 35 protein E1
VPQKMTTDYNRAYTKTLAFVGGFTPFRICASLRGVAGRSSTGPVCSKTSALPVTSVLARSATSWAPRRWGFPRRPEYQWRGVQARTGKLAVAAVRMAAAAEDAASGGVPKPVSELGIARRLKIGSYFLLWYLFNIVYNISNKTVLNAMGGGGWIVAWLQLALGIPYILLVWTLGIRKAPTISLNDVQKLLPVAAAHTLGHLCTVLSFGAVAISFTHVVKALEPFVNVVGSAIFLRSVFPLPVYASLIPVVAGVIMASVSEATFNWMGFLTAMGSNFAFTARNIFSKINMTTPKGQNMTPMNLYAVLTILSTFLLLPFALIAEWRVFPAAWRAAVAAMTLPKLLVWVGVSGLFFYLYNEIAFMALDSVHPITHAVGNTVKRVVIIIASVIVFKNPIDWRGWLGSAIAIGGVLLYSLVKNYYETRGSKQQR